MESRFVGFFFFFLATKSFIVNINPLISESLPNFCRLILFTWDLSRKGNIHLLYVTQKLLNKSLIPGTPYFFTIKFRYERILVVNIS